MISVVLIGIVGGLALLFGAILLEGSSPTSFLNLLATVVVVGGGTMAVMAIADTARFTIDRQRGRRL